jgi:transposase
MTHYAGLDVSLEETAICVVDGTGRIVKEARAASEPEALVAALSKIDVPLDRIGLEACSLTAWLHDELRAAGWPAICIETRQANAAMKTMPNKTDRSDARALAQIMRTGPPRSADRGRFADGSTGLLAVDGIGRSTSRAANAGCGVRCWSHAARS